MFRAIFLSFSPYFLRVDVSMKSENGKRVENMQFKTPVYGGEKEGSKMNHENPKLQQFFLILKKPGRDLRLSAA